MIIEKCCFNFQTLLRQAIAKGAAVIRNAQVQPDKHIVFLEVLSLALLPKEEIEATFQEIEAEARKKFKDFDQIFDSFFRYFETNWLRRRGVDDFCVFEQSIRTNNSEESYHAILIRKMRNVSPTPQRFIGNNVIKCTRYAVSSKRPSVMH